MVVKHLLRMEIDLQKRLNRFGLLVVEKNLIVDESLIGKWQLAVLAHLRVQVT